MRAGPCENPQPTVARPADNGKTLNPRQYRLLMAATITGSAIAFVDGSIVAVAIPAIRDGLDASIQQMQWIVNGYALMLAAFILPGGAAGDVFGRKRVFLWGVAIYTLASLWCALASSAPELIVARIAEGFGGALMIPASLALITVNVAKAERGSAIGLWAAAGAAATAIGPILGGTLIDTLGWRFALLLTVPFGVLTFAIAMIGVAESRDAARRMDWPSGLLACASLGGFAYALTAAIETPGLHVAFVAIAAIGLAAAFLFRQARTVEPMMPLSLFTVKAFSGSNGLTFLLYGALAASFFFLPIMLIDAHDYSATAAGLALLPFTVVISVFSRFAGGLSDRMGARLPLTAGPFLTGVGFALLAPVAISGNFLFHLLPVMLILGVGMGLTAAPLSTTVMNAVREDFAGVASGINNAISRAAGLLFVAGFGIVAQAGFAWSGAAGQYGEGQIGGLDYRSGIVMGFIAVTLGCALCAFAAAWIGFRTLKSTEPAKVSP